MSGFPCCTHCTHSGRASGHVLSCSECLRELCAERGASWQELAAFLMGRQ